MIIFNKIKKSNSQRVYIKWIFFFSIFFFLTPNKIFSQDSLLKFQKAVEILLNNNYDIRIAGNNRFQAENNNSAGNAGMLPRIDANGSYTKSSNSLKQKYNTGNEVNRTAASADNTSGDIGGVWTIFDGLKMFGTKEKLSERFLQSKEQLQIQMENSILEVTKAYYSLVKQQQLLLSIQEEIKFAKEREKIAERKLNNGSGSRLELLQAKTDLNRQRTLEIKIKSEADADRISLNQLLGRTVETLFTVEDSVNIVYQPQLDELKKSAFERNSLLSYYKHNKRIAELELKEIKALRMPVINLNAHYTFSKNTNEAGFILYNRSNGFNYGASATLPLFRGFTINSQVKNAKLEAANAKLEYESANAQVDADLYNSWRTFNDALAILRIEEQNIVYAKEVLTVAQERYRIGASNNAEILDAQRTYEEAMARYAEAKYTAKVTESVLKKVNGELIVFGEEVK